MSYKSFQFFPENAKKDANTSPSEKLNIEGLGRYSSESESVQRSIEEKNTTKLKVDYSDFSNHVFLDSAVEKFEAGKNRILNDYPFNGTSEEKSLFHLTSSQYEEYLFDIWPKYSGYTFYDGTQYFSASDSNNKLLISSSSFYISAWVRPVISTENIFLQVLSSSGTDKFGYDFYFSGALDPHVKFTLYSGSVQASVSSSYENLTSSFNNVAVIYDKVSSSLKLYLSSSLVDSTATSFGPVEFKPSSLIVGSGSKFDGVNFYENYSGSLDELRIFLTASDSFHEIVYDEPVNAENELVAHYKFNESITGVDSVDSVIIDYSKSGLHANVENYTSTFRVSGSAMTDDDSDIVLYNFNPDFVSFSASISMSASVYDNNNRSIFNLVASDILDEDLEAEGLLRLFLLSSARYLDGLKSYADQFNNLKFSNLSNKNTTPDIFLPYIQQYFGLDITEHFRDSDLTSLFYGRGVKSSGSLSVPIAEIKNEFWRRSLDNLPYLLKSKGKRHSIDIVLNSLGINKNSVSVKEYGQLPGNALQDSRIRKEKTTSFLAIGTASHDSVPDTTGSYMKSPNLISSNIGNDYTFEIYTQLPYLSASYVSTALPLEEGALWQLVSEDQQESFTLHWNVTNASSGLGKLLLTGSDGQLFSSSELEIFDGNFINIAAGLRSGSPFIQVRKLDFDEFSLESLEVGGTELSGVFTASDYSFVFGANSGSLYERGFTGYIGEVRYWDRSLTDEEIASHAYHFESVGVSSPLTDSSLVAHWPLFHNFVANDDGVVYAVDATQNNNTATGSLFEAGVSPYKKFSTEYNFNSPAFDLRFSDNKVRIRNKSELKLSEAANDNNDFALEFNLVDALNEDISKIFSSFDVLNEALGQPVAKYRDEYELLEQYRRVYFERLIKELNFTSFFKLYRWFDKKLSNTIKQLLPARVNFYGGEHVIESHALERPKYQYQYPIFRTPKEVPETTISGNRRDNIYEIDSEKQKYLEHEGTVAGTYTLGLYDTEKQRTKSNESGVKVSDRNSLVSIEADISVSMVDPFLDGDDRVDRNPENFFRVKLNGDTKNDILNPNVTLNSKNEWAKRKILEFDRDNIETVTSNTGNIYINSKIGNANVLVGVDSSKNNEFYFGSANKEVEICMSGAALEFTSSLVFETGSTSANYFVQFLGAGRDSKGVWYTAGQTTMSGNVNITRWHVLKSVNQGRSWSLIDNNGYASDSGRDEKALDIVGDSAGNLFSCGRLGDPPTGYAQATVRKSTDGGANWTTVDGVNTLDAANFSGVVYNRLYLDPATQNLYALGQDDSVWLNRRSTDQGASWTTLDTFNTQPSYTGAAHDLVVRSSDGLIISVGWEEDSFSPNATWWACRTSDNDGSTFTTQDLHTNSSQETCRAYTVVEDAAGNIYAGGILDGNWAIKKNDGGGLTGSWDTVDQIVDPVGGEVRKLLYDSNHDIVYALGSTATNAALSALTGNIKFTLDNGTTWENLDIQKGMSGGFQDGFITEDGRLLAFGPHGPGQTDVTDSYYGRVFEYSIFGQSATAPGSASFVVTGSSTVPGYAQISSQKNIITQDNTVINDSETVSKFFTSETVSGALAFDVQVSFEVSASNTTFSSADFSAYYSDQNSAGWGSFKNITNLGTYSQLSDGWYRYTSNIKGSEYDTPSVLLTSSLPNWSVVVNAQKTYGFRNFKTCFKHPLSENGLEIFKDSNLASSKRNLMPVVSEDIRRQAIYTFENVSRLSQTITGRPYNKILKASNGNFYAVGQYQSGLSERTYILGTFSDPSKEESDIDLISGQTVLDGFSLVDVKEDSNGTIWALTSAGKVISGSGIPTTPWLSPGQRSMSATSLYIEGTDLYIGGYSADKWLIAKSTDLGVNWSDHYAPTVEGAIRGITKFGSDMYFVAEDLGLSSNLYVYKDTAFNGIFAQVDNVTDASDYVASWIEVNDSNIYYGGYNEDKWVVRKSSDGSSWASIIEDRSNQGPLRGVAFDSDNVMYLCGGGTFNSSVSPGIILKSEEQAENSWDIVFTFTETNDIVYDIETTSNDAVVACGAENNKPVFLYSPKQTNADLIGPQMLSTSARYFTVNSSGVLEFKAQLFNVSEFPHSMGFFQMPSLILGTQETGKIGDRDDDLIKVEHFGSVVKVMWPPQEINQPVRGFGDLAAGQRPGKLTTSFAPGTFQDVTDFDHLALYCYPYRAAEGTLDNVEIKIERRPLRSTGFTVDQAIDYSISGSFAVGELRDIIYKKEVDYSDTTVADPSFVIDVPLTNVRELRISARHSNGQSVDQNKTFLVWGRLIKSEKET